MYEDCEKDFKAKKNLLSPGCQGKINDLSQNLLFLALDMYKGVSNVHIDVPLNSQVAHCNCCCVELEKIFSVQGNSFQSLKGNSCKPTHSVQGNPFSTRQHFSVLGNPGPQSQPRVCAVEQLQLRPPSPPKVWTHWEPEDTEKGEKQNNMKHLSLIKELFTLLSVPAALCFFTKAFETI